jgi:hypothetical protein
MSADEVTLDNGIVFRRIIGPANEVGYRAQWPDSFVVYGLGDLMLMYEDEPLRPVLIERLEERRSAYFASEAT